MGATLVHITVPPICSKYSLENWKFFFFSTISNNFNYVSFDTSLKYIFMDKTHTEVLFEIICLSHFIILSLLCILASTYKLAKSQFSLLTSVYHISIFI